MPRAYTCIAAAFALLSGCATYSKIETAPIDVAFTSPLVARSAVGFRTSQVRTRAETAGPSARDAELIGARCAIEGDGFRADVVTPAQVRLPVFEGSAEPLVLRCQAGDVTAERSFRAINRSREGQGNGFDDFRTSSGVAIGVGSDGRVRSRATIVLFPQDPSRDRYGYRALLTVTLAALPDG